MYIIFLVSESPDPVCLSPHFRLLRMCEHQQNWNLDNIDALLGKRLQSYTLSVCKHLKKNIDKRLSMFVNGLCYCIHYDYESQWWIQKFQSGGGGGKRKGGQGVRGVCILAKKEMF